MSEREKRTREIIVATFVAPLLCLALVLVIKSGSTTDYYNLIRQFILSITSVIIVMTYLVGIRRFMKFDIKHGGVDDGSEEV